MALESGSHVFFLWPRESVSIPEYKTATVKTYSLILISGGTCLAVFFLITTIVLIGNERVEQQNYLCEENINMTLPDQGIHKLHFDILS